jgi:hypothetical protein
MWNVHVYNLYDPNLLLEEMQAVSIDNSMHFRLKNGYFPRA